MKYLLIAPTRYIPNFLELVDGLFLVPEQLTDESVELISELRVFKMVDNGAYESEPISDEKLIELATAIGADVVIAPDVLNKRTETIRRITEFLDYDIPMEVMIVPQGANPVEFVLCLKQLLPLEGYSYIGFPIWLNKRFHCRPEIVKYCQKKLDLSEKKLHLLGLDNPYEVLLYENVTSVDTSLPVTLAKNFYQELFPMDFNVMRLSRIRFDEELSPLQFNLAKRLIKDLVSLCHGE